LRRALAAGACAIAALGCARDKDQAPRSVSLNPAIPVRDAGPAVAQDNGPRQDYAWRPQIDGGNRPFQIMVTKTVPIEGGAAPAKPVNPDDAVLEGVRVAAGGCFRSLPGWVPTRTAHIALTVISTGSVSRADVSSPDTTDATVIDCIQQQALGAAFSDNANGPLRTYAIDVRVSATR
jgi:hypothetical protein